MDTLDPLPFAERSEHLAPAPAYSVVVIGASAGGIPALISLLSALRPDFLLLILVVQHLPAGCPAISQPFSAGAPP